MSRRSRRSRSAGRWCWLAIVVLASSSCLLAPIPGDAPLRYRDIIFSSVTKTPDIVYGSAQDQLGNIVDLKLDVYQPDGDTVAVDP